MFARTDKFGFRVVLPAVLVLAATLATVVFSLLRMADEANEIEDALTERSAVAAVQSFVRHLGESHGDYAQWDDAVRSLYGTIDEGFVEQNFIASTATATFFDTFYLLDEDGRDVVGYRFGEKLREPSREVFGPSLNLMATKVPSDGRTYAVETGLVRTKWGLVALAVGPVVANTDNLTDPPVRSRILVMAKAFDEAAVQRLGEDFVIESPRLLDAGSGEGIALTNPIGHMVGRFGWSARSLGTQAQARVGPTVFIMLGLLTLTMGVLIFLAVRGLGEIQRREAASRHAATHDELTGLPNRTALIHGLDAALAEARGDSTPCVLVYLDLDGFKEVNDAYGHAAGDQLLRMVAARFRSIGAGHLLARLGGDEFSLLVKGDQATKQACVFGQAAIDILRKPFDIDGRAIVVGTSLGVAVSDMLDLSAEELLRRADVAMYQAKQDGPNRYFVYDSLIDKSRHERIGIANDLRRAIRENELSVVYQPVFAAHSREIVAAEALLRWTRPEVGPVPPSVFIPIAEETGLIEELGLWALRRACSETLDWADVRLAVNVSPAQFRNPNFETVVASVLRGVGFPAERLEIEVTESYFLTHPEQARVAIDALRRLGVTVSLDDFGTGYSSIGYLRRFKFDKLKLDRSLIVNIETDQAAQRLVQATIALADALGLGVTAEGVETEEEAVILRAAGCHELQGFLLAKPCSPDQFARQLNVHVAAHDVPAALSA